VGILTAYKTVRQTATRVGGAVAGQLSQALGSFVLQVIAARALGASGLGVFALLYGLILVATAVANGLVGDSLTILERRKPDIRAALMWWNVISAGLSGIAGGLFFWASGIVPGVAALLFATTVATFMVESNLRRVLMATMRFWFLVIVDVVATAASLVVLVCCHIIGAVTLNWLLGAWTVGQILGCWVALICCPPAERRLGPWRRPAMRQVAAFGAWRAAQQCVRPGELAAARFLLTIAVGRALFGQLEAARVYMAPAMLVVGGLGSYLFSSYALKDKSSLGELIPRADRASVSMMVLTLGMGGLATLVTPSLGSLITGSSFSMVPLAVFGWAVFAASSAAVMPYASLAAIRGRQHIVMVVRSADLVLSLLALAIVVFALGLDISWAPYVLAAGSFVGGALIRQFVLIPSRSAENARIPSPGFQHTQETEPSGAIG
jgi:O-antigen/teichoic acid export membrane protein